MILGLSWGALGLSGAVLGLSGDHLGLGGLGCVWRLFRPSWACLGQVWVHLRPAWAGLGPALISRVLGCLGLILGLSWAVSGDLGCQKMFLGSSFMF